MIRRIALWWHDHAVGSIEVPASFRAPIAQAELDAIPCTLFIRSRSWLYDVRPGDVTLHVRTIDGREEVVAIASPRMCPGDIGCIVGFEASPDHPHVRPDEKAIARADEILKQSLERPGR